MYSQRMIVNVITLFNSSKTWKITNFCLQQKLIITLHISIIYFKETWWAKIVKIQWSDNGILKWINGRKKNENFNATKNKTNF